PASAWESFVLPARVRDYSPAMLDELTATGEVLWSGHGELARGDGWVALHVADAATLTLPEPQGFEPGDLHRRILDAFAGGGASFLRQLGSAAAADGAVTDAELATALWELVWAGLVGNDTFAPLRARLGATATRSRSTPRSRPQRLRAR